jgi:hypothetical protein
LEGGNGFCSHTDRATYIQRFVPPESIYYKIKDGEHEHDNLQFCDGQMLNFMCDALEYKPAHLNNYNSFGEKISFVLILDFFLGDILLGESILSESERSLRSSEMRVRTALPPWKSMKSPISEKTMRLRPSMI